ncbi:hypothetical protein ACFOQM_19055 [Paenibacillus sp. GCM10012307]|uniref:Uncharacterized protein n=1 Tax=Paenibacillus roseus TaxID=2798579 RepID=A0A934JA92_9BACL|nr:hypothetical protein [Paenibacillus roseus]MBJ6363322.1 hypothetical protein [Paenibacillus roseus]
MSKKLEGNGRWESSRMMLPEHREQYLQMKAAQSEQPRAQIPTREELELIRDAVLLPMMLSVVDKNYREMEASTSSLKRLYMVATNVLLNRIHRDLARVKRELRNRSIKVFEDERVDSALHYHFVCRGYENQFAMLRDVIRTEMSVRMTKYIQEMTAALTAG